MMDDATFDSRRAEQELERALRSTESAAIRAHRDLASAYLSRLGPEQQATVQQRVRSRLEAKSFKGDDQTRELLIERLTDLCEGLGLLGYPDELAAIRGHLARMIDEK